MVGNSEHVSGWGDLGCVFAIQQPSRLMLLAHPSCANKTWKRMDDAKLKFYTGKKDVLLPNLFNSNFFWTIPPLFRHLQIMTQWTSNLHHIMVIFLGKWTTCDGLTKWILQFLLNYFTLYTRWNHHKSCEHRAAAPLTFWVPDIFQAWNQNFIIKYWPSDAKMRLLKNFTTLCQKRR